MRELNIIISYNSDDQEYAVPVVPFLACLRGELKNR